MILRSTKHDREQYFAHPGHSHSSLKKFFEWRDPSNKIEDSPYEEQKRSNKIGSLLHSKTLTPRDTHQEFYILSGRIPGDKAVQVLNYAFELAMNNEDMERISYLDNEQIAPFIIEACRPGNALEDGYGGNWKDETKVSKILDEAGKVYWEELIGSIGKVRIGKDESVLVDDMFNRLVNSEYWPLFNENTYDHPGIKAYFEYVNVDIDFEGMTFKFMADLVIVNNSKYEFMPCKGVVVRPNRYKIFELKYSAKPPKSFHSVIKSYRYDRQLAKYSKLFKKLYPAMLEELPAVIFVSSVKNSSPVMWELSSKDYMIAWEGRTADGFIAYDKDIRNALTERTPGFVHGVKSMIAKFKMCKDMKIETMDVEPEIYAKGYASTNLWHHVEE